MRVSRASGACSNCLPAARSEIESMSSSSSSGRLFCANVAEVLNALQDGLNVLMCVGETAEERGGGTLDEQKPRIEKVLAAQVIVHRPTGRDAGDVRAQAIGLSHDVCDARLASDGTGALVVLGTSVAPVSPLEAYDSYVQWQPSRFLLGPLNGLIYYDLPQFTTSHKDSTT